MLNNLRSRYSKELSNVKLIDHKINQPIIIGYILEHTLRNFVLKSLNIIRGSRALRHVRTYYYQVNLTGTFSQRSGMQQSISNGIMSTIIIT
jgi:hypothetical protein